MLAELSCSTRQPATVPAVDVTACRKESRLTATASMVAKRYAGVVRGQCLQTVLRLILRSLICGGVGAATTAQHCHIVSEVAMMF